MCSDKDSNTQVVTTNNLCEASILSVVQTNTAKILGDLKAKSTKFTHPLNLVENAVYDQ